MANEQPVENLMKSTMENLRDMIDVNTVIGDPVETKDGTYVIPVSRLTFGFASGGSEYSSPRVNPEDKDYPFGGGSGAGVSVRPVAFLVVKEDTIRMIPVEHDNTYDRIIDNVPQVLDVIKNFIKDLSNNKNNNCKHGNNKDVDSNNLNYDANHNL